MNERGQTVGLVRFRSMKAQAKESSDQVSDVISLLPPEDLLHLMAADGYLELGMRQEADAELKAINPEVRRVIEGVPVILEVRFRVRPGSG